MLAHELRNPVSSIHNAVQFLGRLEREEDREWAKEVVQRQVSHLGRLIDDLLDVSRISSGKIILKKEPLNLAPIVTSAVETVRPLIEQRKHELTISLAPGMLHVEADPLRLEQVLVNLLTNAAKYSESGGHIWLTAARDGTEVVVKVRDSGIGISHELLPRIFDLFTQGDRSMARSEGGLGIGLTLVKSLIEMHGGTVTAESDGFGHGSTFIVHLPAAQAPAIPKRKSSSIVPTSVERSLRILVVDDNADAATGLSKLLGILGHDVKIAYDGRKALEIGRSFRPEVVLLDIGLPGMDGYQVVKQLRMEECCKDALIIAVSGYGQEEDRNRSKVAGFDYHLVNPIDYEVLMRFLGRSG
jgi:CheY-like chemotaxis protein/two-component sensor histidine kinase